jgi:hypothetical protein
MPDESFTKHLERLAYDDAHNAQIRLSSRAEGADGRALVVLEFRVDAAGDVRGFSLSPTMAYRLADLIRARRASGEVCDVPNRVRLGDDVRRR